jgi:predicted dehydrogenase
MTMAQSKQLRVGVIGCGGIAQMMHLPFLFSMTDKFEITALCDLSPGVLKVMGSRYHVPANALFTRYEDLVALDLDAILVLTGGDHFLQVKAALQAGKHVFVEKPLCFSIKEADELIVEASQANRILQVGYMKRYDPGYLYAQQCTRQMTGIRYVQINTLHPSEDDYLRIHNLVRFNDISSFEIQALRQVDDQHIINAVGNVSSSLKAMYSDVFLGSMVHDINAMRGLLGEPERVLFSELWPADQQNSSVTTVIKYPGETRVVFTWTYLNDLRNYFEEIALMSPANRLRIQFPSPYLRHFPSPVVFEGMEEGASFEKRVTASYDEAFRLELVALYENITNNQLPLTSATDARSDIMLLQEIFASLHPQGLGGEAAQRSKTGA